MELKIEHGIPIPKKGTRNKSGMSVVIRSMQVGDCVFFGGKQMSGIYGYLRTAQILGYKFTCRKVDGGVRVWRIA